MNITGRNLILPVIALATLTVGVSIAFWGARMGRKGAIQGAASFHLNPDNKKWYYNILTSKGASAIAVE